MIRIVLLCLLVFVSGCTNGLQFKDLEKGVRYSLVKENRRLMSFEAPIGTWNNLRYIDQPKEDIARKVTILNGQSPLAWGGYEVRFGLQNIELFEKKKGIFYPAILSGDMIELINAQIQAYYSEEWRKEVGVTDVSGSLTEIGGFSCIQIDSTQNLGPPTTDQKWGDNHLTIYSSDISCPLVIEGELWELLSYDRITIATRRFNQHYGDNAPTVEEIRQDLRARLQPMFDSVIVYGNPSQSLPDKKEGVH